MSDNTLRRTGFTGRSQLPPVTTQLVRLVQVPYQSCSNVLDAYFASPYENQAGKLLSTISPYLQPLVLEVCPTEDKQLKLISALGGRVRNDSYLLDYLDASNVLPERWKAAVAILRNSLNEASSLTDALNRSIHDDVLSNVKVLLETCPQLLACRHDGMTPLLKATALGRYEIVSCLLTKGAKAEDRVCNPNESAVPLDADVDGFTCQSIHEKLVFPIMDHPAYAIAGRNALTLALFKRDFAMLKTVIDGALNAARKTQVPAVPGMSCASFEMFSDLKAIAKRMCEQVRIFLDSPTPYPHIDDCDGSGDTPLTLAVDLFIRAEKKGDAAGKEAAQLCIQRLIAKYGANVNKPNDRGSTPLMLAASAGSEDLINTLLAANANPWIASASQEMPLVVAGLKGHDLTPLLNKLCTTKARDDLKKALFRMAQCGSVGAIAQLLAHVGKNFFSPQQLTGALACLACYSHSFPSNVDTASCIDLLLAHGATLTMYDEAMHQTPLQVACGYGSPDVVKQMLAALAPKERAKALAEKNNGVTLLYCAIRTQRIDLIDVLLADLKPRQVLATLQLPVGRNGAPAMHTICRTGNAKLLDLLLTVLNSLPEEKKSLLAWNVRAAGIDFCPLTVIFTSVEPGRIDVANVLIDHGADVDQIDNYGGTALHFACFGRDAEMVSVLLARGANPNARNYRQETPLECMQLSEGDKESEQAIQALFASGSV